MAISTADLARYRGAAGRFRSTPCTLSRAHSTVYSGLCRIVPKGSYQPVPGVSLLQMPLWELHLEAGTDVRPADVISALGNTYAVTHVEDPRTYEVERLAAAYLVADPAEPSGAYVLANAAVDVKHGTESPAHYVGRRVHLSYPTRAERAMAQGAQLPTLLIDLPDADYREGDQCTIVAVDGHTAVPHPQHVTVGTVDRLSGPPPVTSVELGLINNPQAG